METVMVPERMIHLRHNAKIRYRTKTGRINRALLEAILIFGPLSEIDKAIEEMSELITTLQHFKEGRVESDKVCEEVADVGIMLESLKLMFGEAAILDWEARKLNRLIDRLDDLDRKNHHRAFLPEGS